MSATSLERSDLAAADPRLRAVVVIPARDEERRIAACLRALADQEGVAKAEYEVILVLDGCRDATAEVIAGFAAGEPSLALHTVELTAAQGVGRARRRGMDIACERLLGLGRGEGLVLSTDADSVVAADWLAAQLALAAQGARAIGGHIELDPTEALELSPEAVNERELRSTERLASVLDQVDAHNDGDATEHQARTEHHQFSGASLALTADAYRECGGLPVRAALEDEALELELRSLGIPIHRSRNVRVLTSARREGRAPRGLARDLARSDWRARRSYSSAQFPLERLLEAKQETIALVLPAREVATTLGPIAETVAALAEVGLLDEVLVVDAGSRDGSARVAAEAGLRVLQEDEIAAELGPAQGKGDAMWRALSMVESEIVAYVDADTERFGEHFVTGLLGPLLLEPEVQLVKGFFRRPFRTAEGLAPDGGGRVTELLARPLLNLHAPDLAVFDQPLAGELAGRRELLERIPFSTGYGVEIAMLIDAWRITGLDGMAQVDMGVRQNRHQPLRELSAMAYAVLVAASTRLLGEEFADANACGSLLLPPLEGQTQMESRRVPIEERPPLAQYRSRTAC